MTYKLTFHSAARPPLLRVILWVEVVRSKPLVAGEVQTIRQLLAEVRLLGTPVTAKVVGKTSHHALHHR